MTTKTAQFTPGPWVITEHSSGMICVAGPDHKDLCAVGYNKTEGRDDAANATLIAAAPAMYTLLQDATLQLARLTGSNLETYARTFSVLAKKALAQAEGRQA